MMTTKGFHHISLVSRNAARTTAFYRDVLGLELIRSAPGYDDPASPHLYFGSPGGAPGTLLTFFEWHDASQGRPGAGGVHHLALTTETAESQLKWKRRLEDHGVHVTGPYDRGWFRSLYFTDPDGQIIEIATRGPGYTLDEAADALGANVVIPPTAELRGERDEAEVRARTYDEPVPEITPDMRLDGLHHISGMTDDVERIGEFYEAALGLRLVKRSVNQDDTSMPHWFWASYDGHEVAPHSALTMFGEWASGGARIAGTLKRAVAGAGQTHHIAFRADDDEQLRAWMDHLRSLDVAVSDVLDRTYFRGFYFHAPDGMLMQIATDTPGFGIDDEEMVP